MQDQLLSEAKNIARSGLIPIVQRLEYNENGKKFCVKSMKYRDLKTPAEALDKIRAYLHKNKDCNALGVLMQDRLVNLDFDSLSDYKDFLERGLVQSPSQERTRVTHTASGKYHYIYQMPESWLGEFVKTTHIGGTDVDVLFGENNVEYVYPTTLPGGQSYSKGGGNTASEMPRELREYLEPFLNRRISNETKPNTPRERGTGIPDTSPLSPLEARLLAELAKFGYKDPALVDRGNEGFNFTYDHKLPDPLDPLVIHEQIDGYVIINEDANIAIVGTYSDKCKRKSAILCNLYEPDECLLDDSSPQGKNRIIEYNDKFVHAFTDVHDDRQVRVSVIESDLGTGKTTQTVAHMKKHNPPNILFLTPRILFGQCLQSNLDGFELYLDHTTGNKKTLSLPRLICQMESLRRINTSMTYDHIYIDEIESCLKQFSSLKTMTRRQECADTFARLLKGAKRIIMCDAHISSRTFKLLENLGFEPGSILLERNHFVARDRVAVELKEKSHLLTHLRECIERRLPVCFFSTSKKFLKIVKKICQDNLERDEYVIYTPEATAEKDRLRNVEEEWKNKIVVAYNTTITVGVDFNLPDIFHTVLVYAMNFGCGPVRDIFQAIHRVRKICSDKIYYYINGASEQDDAPDTERKAIRYVQNVFEINSLILESSVPDDDRTSAPLWLYNLHIANILEDGISKRHYRKVFEQYLSRCGYDKKVSRQSYEEEDEIDIKEDEIDYDQIPELTRDEYEEYEVRVYSCKANREEQLAFYKYQYQFELGFSNKRNFSLMFNNMGRSWLKNVKSEKCLEPYQVLNDSDYLDITGIDAIFLDGVKEITKILGLENSYEKKELLQSAFETGALQPYIDRLHEILKVKKTKKRITQINQIMKQWNGNQFEPVKGSNVCTKTVKINGKREKIVQLQGYDYS